MSEPTEKTPDQKYFQKFGKKVKYEDIADLAEAYQDFVARQSREYFLGSHVQDINSEGEELH